MHPPNCFPIDSTPLDISEHSFSFWEITMDLITYVTEVQIMNIKVTNY